VLVTWRFSALVDRQALSDVHHISPLGGHGTLKLEIKRPVKAIFSPGIESFPS
jgi:hypothetical protein